MLIIKMYVTLLPLIVAGMANMAFCRSSILSSWYRPIDQGLVLSDGKRLFGDNKTWKGFVGMMFFGAFFQWMWGFVAATFPLLLELNLVYDTQLNTAAFNLLFGLLLGFAYVLFELPNSWLKRRFDVEPGKLAMRYTSFFFVLDQIDSLIGCVLVLAMFRPISLSLALSFVLLGALTHVGINQILYGLKWRKNRF